METARADRSSAAAPSASSPRAPGSAPARWRARSAASAASRSRPARAVAPGRRPRHRAGPPRLADPPAQGQAPGRARAHLPAHRATPRRRSPRPVTARIWPNVELQWEWLGGLPPLRKAAVIGAGSWGTAVAVLLARGGLEVAARHPHRRAGRGDRTRRARTSATCPASSCPTALDGQAGRARSSSPASTWSASRSRRRRCRRRSARSPTGSARAPRCCCSPRAWSPPLGALPTEYVGERVRARAIACLGGPAHAREAVAGTAALVLGSARRRPARPARRGLRPRRPRLRAHRRRRSASRSPGAAKNAAALAAAAAEPHGLNAAGIAAAEVWRECVELRARARRPSSRPSPASPASAT